MRNKSHNDHSNSDWRNLKKQGENFRRFKFYRTRFEFGVFTDCNFSAVSAKNACFIKADLSGSDFAGANLEGANFGGATLVGVNFKGAILHHANFEGANTDGACFTGVGLHKTRKLQLTQKQVYELVGADHRTSNLSVAEIIEKKANKSNSAIVLVSSN